MPCRSSSPWAGYWKSPIKFINSMSSGWKKFSGGLVASTATMGAMVMAQKALAMASFASAQANTMINLSVLDEAKARLQSAVFTRQQHVEQAEFNFLKRMEQKRSMTNTTMDLNFPKRH